MVLMSPPRRLRIGEVLQVGVEPAQLVDGVIASKVGSVNSDQPEATARARVEVVRVVHEILQDGIPLDALADAACRALF
eukprot:2716183-Pyramimonas_sp.AAC.2